MKERTTAQESPLTIFVNGREMVTLLCTPDKLQFLILGHLYFQGLIQNPEDVASITVCPDEPIAQVTLVAEDVALPPPRVLPSGCGSAPSLTSQSDSLAPLESALQVKASELIALMGSLAEAAELYRAHGGVHISGLADRNKLLVTAEDIGRHNTLDKIQGECLYRRLATQDRILLTTGRLSSEMVDKAALMRVPIAASRNSPTERAVAVADRLGMTLVGYLRGEQLSVYTHHARIEDLASA